MTRIGKWAFAYCGSLTSVVIPDSVQYIGPNAFNSCDDLTIHCNRGSAASSFAKKEGIPYIYPGGVHILVLPANLTAIGREAFANLTNVDEVHIPASVQSIDDSAFAGSDVVICAPAGSYAAAWAQAQGFEVGIE